MFLLFCLTATTESRAATATMSAHDTTCGHILSSRALMLSITSNPRRELLFGTAVFSPVKVGVSSSSTEPSQACEDCHAYESRKCENICADLGTHTLTKQSWKWRRSNDAPMRFSLATADLTAVWLVYSAFGHDLS